MTSAIVISADDNVATALEAIEPGQSVRAGDVDGDGDGSDPTRAQDRAARHPGRRSRDQVRQPDRNGLDARSRPARTFTRTTSRARADAATCHAIAPQARRRTATPRIAEPPE